MVYLSMISCNIRMIGVVVFMSSWDFMDVGPLVMGMDVMEVKAAVQIIGCLVKYGCRVGCVEEDLGFGVPVWSSSVGTPKE